MLHIDQKSRSYKMNIYRDFYKQMYRHELFEEKTKCFVKSPMKYT